MEKIKNPLRLFIPSLVYLAGRKVEIVKIANDSGDSCNRPLERWQDVKGMKIGMEVEQGQRIYSKIQP